MLLDQDVQYQKLLDKILDLEVAELVFEGLDFGDKSFKGREELLSYKGAWFVRLLWFDDPLFQEVEQDQEARSEEDRLVVVQFEGEVIAKLIIVKVYLEVRVQLFYIDEAELFNQSWRLIF